ncbi:MAG: hypothetical protein FJ271_15785 [Planctomycetes bacterium]|nr:hypothetical protein [Planctomycetota bacterium]
MTTTESLRETRMREMLAVAQARVGGNIDWREWKKGQAARFVDLALKAPRLHLHSLDLSGDVEMVYEIAMPAPRWPTVEGLVLANRAVFHLVYQEGWRWESPAGWMPMGILEPFDIFHPNCRPSPGLRGAICLGNLPPGTQLTELVLLGYYAISNQLCGVDETSPQGILNPFACEYYRDHPEYRPLTRAGLLDPWEGGN